MVRRQMRRRFLSGVLGMLILVAALSQLVGCSTGSQKEGKTAGTTQENGMKLSGELILATTTSTQDTGLLDKLVPLFEELTGVTVKTVAVGTGEALAMGERGDADVLLVHAPKSEQELVDAGHAIDRTAVMHNDFVIIGPEGDSVGIADCGGAAEALGEIAVRQASFVSRGDDSGTHKKEKALWDIASMSPSGAWYIEAGQGMGATLRIAEEKQAYTLTDRGTFLATEGLTLVLLLEGGTELRNDYHVMAVNPELYPDVNYDAAKAFIEFMVSADVQQIIKEFGVERFGQPLFFPDVLTE